MRFPLAFFLMLTFSIGFSQLNNKVFEDRLTLDQPDSGKLFVGLNALGFFKNNEYKKTVVNGYTLFGYQFQPTLSYHLTKNIRMDAGAYFQQDFGSSSPTTIAPIFSIKWKSKDYSVIFGNLEGSLNHRLIEPLYDFERVLNNRLETGVQIQLQHDGFFFDTWIDWQYMQHLNDSRQEQFVGGVSLMKRIVRVGNGSLSIPFQVVSRHQGGQLDTAHMQIQTLVNSAIGLQWTQLANGWIKQFSINGFYVYDKDLSRSRQAYFDGDGWYANGTISTKFGLDVMATYWQGHEFQSAQGGRVYPAVSTQDPGVIQPTPQIFMLRFLYDYKVADQLYLTLRYEPYYDMAFKSFQYSYGIYVNYRTRYFVAKPGR